jgi:hypothetical protein
MPFAQKHVPRGWWPGWCGAAEGDPPNSTLVLRFADRAAARGLLEAPDYQSVNELRLESPRRDRQSSPRPSRPPSDAAPRTDQGNRPDPDTWMLSTRLIAIA